MGRDSRKKLFSKLAGVWGLPWWSSGSDPELLTQPCFTSLVLGGELRSHMLRGVAETQTHTHTHTLTGRFQNSVWKRVTFWFGKAL